MTELSLHLQLHKNARFFASDPSVTDDDVLLCPESWDNSDLFRRADISLYTLIYVARYCNVETISHIGKHPHLHWDDVASVPDDHVFQGLFLGYCRYRNFYYEDLADITRPLDEVYDKIIPCLIGVPPRRINHGNARDYVKYNPRADPAIVKKRWFTTPVRRCRAFSWINFDDWLDFVDIREIVAADPDAADWDALLQMLNDARDGIFRRPLPRPEVWMHTPGDYCFLEHHSHCILTLNAFGCEYLNVNVAFAAHQQNAAAAPLPIQCNVNAPPSIFDPAIVPQIRLPRTLTNVHTNEDFVRHHGIADAVRILRNWCHPNGYYNAVNCIGQRFLCRGENYAKWVLLDHRRRTLMTSISRVYIRRGLSQLGLCEDVIHLVLGLALGLAGDA